MNVVFLIHSFLNITVISDLDLFKTAHAEAGHFFPLFEEKMLVKYVLVVQTCTVLVSSNMRQKRQCK